MPTKETFGERVARLRRREGLTQEELATEAGVTVATVRNVEQGIVTNPSGRTLDALSGPLGVSTDYLITGKHPARRS